MEKLTTSERHIPQSLKRHNHWVLWGVDEKGRKRPLAPWVRGDLYPVKWGADAPERPETDWRTARMYWRDRENYNTPKGISSSEVLPAPLLLHDPLDPPLMLVDFDDVRDPATGEVTDEVVEIVERLGAFCEVSQSGEGLHLFVRAELPGDLGKFIAPLNDTGDIELYDHGRAVGATWDHVDGTPQVVPEAQDTVEELIREYESPSQRKRRLDKTKKSKASSDGGGSISLNPSKSRNTDDETDISPYFKINIMDVADTGYFSAHRKSAPGDDYTGPHPGHGPQHSDPDDCTNFGVVDGDNVWYCFAHDSGGRAIELAAVLCPDTAIDCGDVPGQNANVGGWLRGKPVDLLKTCLWLREQGAVDADAAPPYDALIGVAKVADLHIRNEESGIIGEANKEIVRAVYDELELQQVVDQL